MTQSQGLNRSGSRELVDPLPRDDEDLLREVRDVLGSVHAPAAKDSLDPAARRAVQLVERPRVAGLGGFDERQEVGSLTRRDGHDEMVEAARRDHQFCND